MRANGSGSRDRDLGANADGYHRGIRLFAMDGALASKDAAFVDDQRTDHDVAEDLPGREDLEATRGADVALDRATDYDIAAADIALDPTMLADRQVALSGQISVHFAVETDVRTRLQPAFELDLVTQHRLSDDGSGFARGSLVEHAYLLAGCYRLVPERLRDRVSCFPRKGHAWSRPRSAIDPRISSTNIRPAVMAIRRRSDRKYGTRSSGMTAS